ncbi:magnesium/cobalt transporter CorA [Spirochaeta dissipatitropha]
MSVVSAQRIRERFVRSRKKKPGTAPGTLIYTGDALDTEIELRLIAYTEADMQEKKSSVLHDFNISEMLGGTPGNKVNWFHVSGIHDSELIGEIGKTCNLHPLLVEDILQTDQRPKLEWHKDYIFMSLRVLSWDNDNLRSEQLSLVLINNTLISFSERRPDFLDEVVSRIAGGRRIRFMKADYLLYALVDAVVDGYFMVLEAVGDGVERLEDQVVQDNSQEVLMRLHGYKREMLRLRKAVWPIREILSAVGREDDSRISRDVQVFFRDVYDHSIQIIETIEALRDLQIGLLDLYMTAVSNRMNEVMKVLTIIATVFMPLTFIAGIYGMNFEWMPELALPWAYPAVLLLMFGIGVGLTFYFRLRKWL